MTRDRIVAVLEWLSDCAGSRGSPIAAVPAGLFREVILAADATAADNRINSSGWAMLVKAIAAHRRAVGDCRPGAAHQWLIVVDALLPMLRADIVTLRQAMAARQGGKR